MKRTVLLIVAMVTVGVGVGAAPAGAIPVNASGTVHATPCKWWC